MIATSPPKKAQEQSEAFFIDMVKPALPQGISSSNLRAVLQRCTVLINTKTHLYVRFAGMQSAVQRFPLDGHYITPAAGKVLADWKEKGIGRSPREVARMAADDRELVALLMDNDTPPSSASSSSTGVQQGEKRDHEETAVAEAGPAAPIIKREPSFLFKRLRLSVIDLCESDEEPLPAAPSVVQPAADNADDDEEEDPFGHQAAGLDDPTVTP